MILWSIRLSTFKSAAPPPTPPRPHPADFDRPSLLAAATGRTQTSLLPPCLCVSVVFSGRVPRDWRSSSSCELQSLLNPVGPVHPPPSPCCTLGVYLFAFCLLSPLGGDERDVITITSMIQKLMDAGCYTGFTSLGRRFSPLGRKIIKVWPLFLKKKPYGAGRCTFNSSSHKVLRSRPVPTWWVRPCTRRPFLTMLSALHIQFHSLVRHLLFQTAKGAAHTHARLETHQSVTSRWPPVQQTGLFDAHQKPTQSIIIHQAAVKRWLFFFTPHLTHRNEHQLTFSSCAKSTSPQITGWPEAFAFNFFFRVKNFTSSSAHGAGVCKCVRLKIFHLAYMEAPL